MNTAISNRILSGKIDAKHSYVGKTVHVYLSSDSVISINKEKILTIPVDSIAKIEKAKFSVGKTALFVGVVGIGVLLIFLLPNPFDTGSINFGPI